MNDKTRQSQLYLNCVWLCSVRYVLALVTSQHQTQKKNMKKEHLH